MPSLFARRGAVLTSFALVLLFGAIVATAALVAKLKNDEGWVEHTRDVQARLSQISAAMRECESAQRGFLLVGNPEFVADFDRARLTIEPHVAGLSAAVADNPAQVDTLAELRRAVADRVDFLRKALDLQRSGRQEESAAMQRDGTGRVLRDRAAAVIGKMSGEEDRLLRERQEASHVSAFWLQGAAGLAALAAGLVGLLVLRGARAQFVALDSANASLRAALETAAEEARKRELAEAQFRQAQKMEAIGQLTGGVAHDFNNMLAIVISALNLIQRRLARGDTDIGRYIDGAMDGAHRAAALTHRLLAFSRQQPLAPAVVYPNALLGGMADMLHRALGESIRLETIQGAGVWRTFVDVGQLEQAILNLAVNARDAMENGGKLTVETYNAALDDAYAAANADVQPGQYVVVAVSDTGEGMPPEVAARAFDPFFTTKAVGKGTGLGLSQVYGFVKQSGGHVKIYSEPGHGTTIRIYLKRHHGEEAPTKAGGAVQPETPEGRKNEIILVVEDEDKVRRLTVDSLRDLGYTVLHAGGARQALARMENVGDVALLLTDIVMPDMNGRQLADIVKARSPETKVLYTTGYTRNAVIHDGRLDPGVNFLAKPFTIDQLATKVRSVLDA